MTARRMIDTPDTTGCAERLRKTDVIERTAGVKQVWIDAVVASKEAAQRDRDIALRELKRVREERDAMQDELDCLRSKLRGGDMP